MSIDDPQVQERLRAALIAAFGSAQADAIEPLQGGASTAFPFRVDRGDQRFVVRVEGERSPLRNPHQYESMTRAAQEGLAPRLYYTNETLGVAVMDFIDAKPLNTYPGGSAGFAQGIGGLIARLQAVPAFPHFVDYTDMVGRLWTYLCSTGLFAPGILDRTSARLARVSEAYRAGFEWGVASHNDLLPHNLLFDGSRLWLIDWESAYLNDPHIDIAIALDNFAPDPACAELLKQAASAHWPERIDPTRLALARALVRLYYAGVLLSAAFAALGPLEDRNLSAPSAEAFERAVRLGGMRLDAPETKHLLGKVFLASFMTGAAPPRLGGSA
ncbi:phosphotransferase [Acidisoma cellulosilytica]|uniref:Phosphotransferase n=1 Tax=Acidisoma cellulosilyticum TaxID=2802395 RepID=A0A963YYC7_9PROT|nr:phosphotransferase [Acidisoma cellulosilyticum]MCB8879472.1 phosphotransferase [Acidisoma cellulosilyticum]